MGNRHTRAGCSGIGWNRDLEQGKPFSSGGGSFGEKSTGCKARAIGSQSHHCVICARIEISAQTAIQKIHAGQSVAWHSAHSRKTAPQIEVAV
jgi:hypothetical protein